MALHLLENLEWTVGGRLDFFDLIDRKWYVSPRTSFTYEFKRSSPHSQAARGSHYQLRLSYVWLVGDPANRSLNAHPRTHSI